MLRHTLHKPLLGNVGAIRRHIIKPAVKHHLNVLYGQAPRANSIVTLPTLPREKSLLRKGRIDSERRAAFFGDHSPRHSLRISISPTKCAALLTLLPKFDARSNPEIAADTIIERHLELVTAIDYGHSLGFFPREFIEALTVQELQGLLRLYENFSRELIHTAMMNEDWFYDLSGVPLYRKLFSIANLIDEDVNLRTVIVGLLSDGHQIYCTGAIETLLFSLSQKRRLPHLQIEMTEPETITFLGIHKRTREPEMKCSALTLDQYDPITDTGYENKIFNIDEATTVIYENSQKVVRVENQILKVCGWLSASKSRRFVYNLIGYPDRALLDALALSVPPHLQHRIRVAIFAPWASSEPLFTAALPEAGADCIRAQFDDALHSIAGKIPDTRRREIANEAHRLKLHLENGYDYDACLFDIIALMEKTNACFCSAGVSLPAELRGQITPFFNQVTNEFRGVLNGHRIPLETDHHELQGVVRQTLAHLRNWMRRGRPEGLVNFISILKRLILILRSASRLDTLRLY